MLRKKTVGTGEKSAVLEGAYEAANPGMITVCEGSVSLGVVGRHSAVGHHHRVRTGHGSGACFFHLGQGLFKERGTQAADQT
jgi:hypothetical protein